MTGGWRMRHPVRRLVAFLLTLDAALAAVGVASVLAGAAGHATLVLVMIALRALTAALEAAGAWLLIGRRPAGVPIVRAAVVAAAVWVTAGIGFRLAPTNLDPAFRLPTVAAYWMVALLVLALLRRG